MRGRRTLVLMLGAALTGGCGHHPVTSTTTAISSTTIAPQRRDPRSLPLRQPPKPKPTLTRTTLSNTDSGATVVTRPGRQITVTLTPTNLGNWTRPQITGQGVLRPIATSGGYPSSQPLHAVYLAAATGTASIATRTDLPCLHARPACLPPEENWQVHVSVR
jgi:hypothetical protein